MPTLTEMGRLHDQMKDTQNLPESEKLEKLIKLVTELTKRVENLELRNSYLDRG